MMETLWDFACAAYRRSGVAECCLRLQDNAGADVNFLLTAAWLAEQGCAWQPEQVRALIADCAEWREHCVLPLRSMRRYLKSHAWYARVKALELDAEIYQLHVLHDALQAMTLRPAATDAFAINLKIYFDCIGIDQIANVADCTALVAALS